MTKKVQNQEEVIVAETVSKAEKFFENHGKKVLAGLVAVLVLVGVGFFYKSHSDKNEVAAQELIYGAQENLKGETPNYELALNGDGVVAGFLDVIEQYGSTPAANLAAQYAGICYMKLGDWDNAEKYLAKYKATKGVPNALINAENVGLQGDVQVQKGDYKKAAALFEKAAAVADNSFTTPLYLKKAAQAYEAAGDEAAATKLYKRIATEYAASFEARDAEKKLGLE